MKQVAHMAPFMGLNTTYVSEEVGVQGTTMRGGYNVEVLDGEWWTRHGHAEISPVLASVLWRWFVPGSAAQDRGFLVSSSYVLWILSELARPGVSNTPDFFTQFDIPYPSAAVASCEVTLGTAGVRVNSVSTGTIAVGQLIKYQSGGSIPDRLYRVISIAAGPPQLLTLDHPWEGGDVNTGAETLTFHDPVLPSGGSGGSLDTDNEGGVVLFEQTAAHAANALGYTHPVINVGMYLLMSTSAGTAAVAAGGNIQPVVKDFVRETQLAAPPLVPLHRLRPGNFKDRAFFLGADQRTVWYSRPLDFMQWHTGLQNLGGTPNYLTLVDPTDPVSGFLPLGDTMVVHRRSSQDILQTYGVGFKPTHSHAAIGFWPPSQMQLYPLGHIGWTRYGPAAFTQQGMSVVLPQLERMLVPWIMAQAGNLHLRGVIHDENRRRIYFLLGYEQSKTYQVNQMREGDKRIIRHQRADELNPQVQYFTPGGPTWYSRGAVLVYDYAREEAWLEDHVGYCGGGSHLGVAYFCRYDGTVVCNTGWSGKDYEVNLTNSKVVVDAQVETQWMEHGVPQRKMLTRIEVLLRALDVSEDVDDITGAKYDPLRIDDLWTSPADTLHLATLEIMIDENDEVRATADLHVSVQEMLDRRLQGNRQLPVMRFSISPRAAGKSFKYRLKNALSPAAVAAGHKQGAFRLVDMVVEYEVETDTRAAGLSGGAP